MNILKTIKCVVIALLVSNLMFVPLSFAVFNPAGSGTYRLQASVGTSNTTIYLSEFKEPVSNIPYTMTYLNTAVGYGTLEPGNVSKREFVSFTGITQNSNGSASITGVTRGLIASNVGASGCTASTTLAQAHSGQSSFILSNSPCFYNEFAIKRNNETITGQWTFDVFPITPSNPAASETTAGISELATGVEAAASTNSGATGFRLTIPASLATSTYNSATAGNKVLVTGTNGFLDSSFIATSTLFATSSIYTVNPIVGAVGKYSFISTTTGTSTFSVPTGVTRVTVWTCGSGGGGGTTAANQGGGGGGGGGCANENVNISGTTTIQYFIGAGGASQTAGNWSTFGTNGFYNSASGGGAGLQGSASGGTTGGTGSGGDFNYTGGGGGAPVATAGIPSGMGGSSMFGGGAPGRQGAGAGFDGGTCGAGGSGANGAAGVGGAGASGCIIIRW